MDACLAAVRAGAADGHVVVASRQTAGRGRTGRSWHSEDDGGLYLSVAIRRFERPAAAAGVTLAAGVAVHDAAASLGATDLDLKWPNDLLIGGRKVAGILTEWLDPPPGDARPAVIIGVGLNVGQRVFPPDLAAAATSLATATGRESTSDEALDAVLDALDAALDAFGRDGLRWAVPEWSHRSRLWGRRARAAGVEGVMVRLDPDGALVVRRDSGAEERLTAGLVELL